MASPESLTKLNAAVAKMDGMPSGGAGYNMKEDIAAALRDIPDDGVGLLLAKYAGCTQSLEKLLRSTHKQPDGYYSLYNQAAWIACKNAWIIKGDKKDKIRRLLNICIIEHIDYSCPTCKGHKVIKTSGNGENRACATCRSSKNSPSTGRMRLSDAQKASILGIKPASWGAWKQRHLDITRLVQNYASDSMSTFIRNMR